MMELNFILIVSSLTLISYSVAFKQPPPLVAFVDLKTQHLTTKNCESLLSRNQHVIVPVSVCLNNQSHKGITSRLFGSRTLIYEPSPGDVRYDFKEGEVCLTSEKRDDIKGVTVPECLDEPNNIFPLKPSTEYPHLLFPVTKDCTVRIELTWHKDIHHKRNESPCLRYPWISVKQFFWETIGTGSLKETIIKALKMTIIKYETKNDTFSINAFKYYFSYWNQTAQSNSFLLSSKKQEKINSYVMLFIVIVITYAVLIFPILPVLLLGLVIFIVYNYSRCSKSNKHGCPWHKQYMSSVVSLYPHRNSKSVRLGLQGRKAMIQHV